MRDKIILKSIAVTIFFAFALNVLLPFFATYNVPAHTNISSAKPTQTMASLFGEKILICTSQGFKLVSWSDLVNGKETPKPHPEYKCPLCYVSAKGCKVALTTAKLVSVGSFNVLYTLPNGYRASLKTSAFWHGHFSRAPPSSIIV